jgi:phosphatidylserine/phosphatidylglycerophosphate/cardiolipin synthase-like enzyme
MIYVHTKILLIDDRYVAIGSANLNKRSMTSDSELQIAVVDDETVDGGLNLQGGGTSHVSVCRFAHELRRRLWGEHLGVDSPASVTEALALWPQWQANSAAQVYHVKVLTPEQGAMYTGLTADVVIQNFDPDTPEWTPKDGVWVSK